MNVYEVMYTSDSSTILSASVYIVAENVDEVLKAMPDDCTPNGLQSIRVIGEAIIADAIPEHPEVAKATPKQIKDSIKPDGLVSFEDGKTYKSLKRHLHKHGLTPAEYRAKWGLPADYGMVSAEYSARRSELAKANGLGTK